MQNVKDAPDSGNFVIYQYDIATAVKLGWGGKSTANLFQNKEPQTLCGDCDL